jgi:hypothetical protein
MGPVAIMASVSIDLDVYTRKFRAREYHAFA